VARTPAIAKMKASGGRNNQKAHDHKLADETHKLVDEDLSEEEDDSDNEEKIEGYVCGAATSTWRIVPNGSVYDAGLLHIVTLCKKPACMKTIYMILSIVFQVCFNACLQVTFATRILTVLHKSETDQESLVFASKGGACSLQPASAYANNVIDLKYVGTSPQNWDCGPLFPMLFSNVSWLDKNGDGYWSEKEEASYETAQKLVTMFAHGGVHETADVHPLRNAFEGFMDDIRNEKFLFQLERIWKHGKQNTNLIDDWASAKYTSNFTQIPMEWMRAEQPSIDLCNNMEKHLCGNLEVRGILNRTVDAKVIARRGVSSSWKRVESCRDHAERCYHKFGEISRAYTKIQREACGEASVTYVESSSVLVTRFRNPDNYDPKTNDHAIGTLNYQTFLLLILIVWGLAMLDELRQVLSWWMVMLFIPCTGTVVEEDDDKIEVKSISRVNKFTIVVLILVPRTIVVVLMSYIGTWFLIETDDYSELILNAVGMGFLMEMDEMIFNGLASNQGKDDIEKLQNIKAEHGAHPYWLDLTEYGLPFVLVIVVLLAVLYPEVSAYTSKEGKIAIIDAYNCLCHAEGPSCIAAQILRGDVRVPRTMFDVP